MSQENVEMFKRGVEAGDRRDIEAMLEQLQSWIDEIIPAGPSGP